VKALREPDSVDIKQAAARLSGIIPKTPVFELDSRGTGPIFIKAECLLPAGSFKVRGAGNAILGLGEVPALIYTASAGNMALAVAWHAARLGSRGAAVVPESAPAAKTDRIESLGAEVLRVPFDEWWQAMLDSHHSAFADGEFVHPFLDPAVIAGNATIGLEIAAQQPEVDAVVVPFGGGGLALGIALGLREAGLEVPVYAAEVETSAPFSAALSAGHPVDPGRTPTFVDGIGGREVFEEIWPSVKSNLAGSIVVSIAETAAALRETAAGTKLLVEGAAAAAVAAALKLREQYARPLAIASGGNIDLDVVGRLLQGSES
jgi:threonine dehydratase